MPSSSTPAPPTARGAGSGLELLDESARLVFLAGRPELRFAVGLRMQGRMEETLQRIEQLAA